MTKTGTSSHQAADTDKAPDRNALSFTEGQTGVRAKGSGRTNPHRCNSEGPAPGRAGRSTVQDGPSTGVSHGPGRTATTRPAYPTHSRPAARPGCPMPAITGKPQEDIDPAHPRHHMTDDLSDHMTAGRTAEGAGDAAARALGIRLSCGVAAFRVPSARSRGSEHDPCGGVCRRDGCAARCRFLRRLRQRW
jgi:hypothetical protein